jgi:hypothetical protein
MNKLFKINLSLLFAAMLFVACESDDNNDPVVPVNVPPNVVDLSMAMSVADGNSATVNLAGTDADGDVITYSIVTQPTQGSVTVSGNVATYTANENADGDDSFTYKANDGQADSNTGTVSVSITGNFVLSGEISDKKTLTADKVWTISGRVYVVDGGELVIPAGTILKAKGGTDTNASFLCIARGGKIDAQGTAEKPIVMTSEADDIQPGQAFGTNLGVDQRGLWGGLLVLGKAPSSFKGDVSSFQIEGIPADDTRGLYGGSDAADNSGVMKYISIRHGGALIGEGNEINGLTLGGVGTGTVIDNIEVVGNVDDGVEFFGGTVNATNLLVWGQGDDGLDIDQAYSGTVDNAVVILESASDHGMEIDGPEGSAAGKFTLKNITLVGSEGAAKGEYNDNRKAATGTIDGLYAYGFKEGDDFELDTRNDQATFKAGDLVFKNIEIVVPSGDALTGGKIFNDNTKKEMEANIANANKDFEAGDISAAERDEIIAENTPLIEDDANFEDAKSKDGATFATSVTAGANTQGADLSKFSWTMAAEKSAWVR